MRWTPGDRDNIDDLRGQSGGWGMRAGGVGLGGLLLLLLLSWVTGTDLTSLFGTTGEPPSYDSVGTSGRVASSPAEERLVDFVDAVMRDAQQTWANELGSRYEPTRAVLFRDSIQSACGMAQSATGPFYCPADHRVYLDLGFFDELQRRFGAPGDFAEAYVLAHELGHHVQSTLGIERKVRQAQQENPSEANALSVKMELQADCLAGVWGHDASQPGRAESGRVELEPGDADEGLRAAAAVGDDRLQRMSAGHVSPERFTHGTSEQRATWFKRGLSSGSIDACNTFAAGR